jgi:DNA replication protein
MNAVPADEAVHAPSPELVKTVIERLWDPLEIKSVLTVASLGGEIRPVEQAAVLEDRTLLRGARGDGSDRDPGERIRIALRSAVARGILIALNDEQGSTWYLTGASRATPVDGALLEEPGPAGERISLRPERPDVFNLYEQNIGMLTPIMANKLVEALELYPEDWISEAIGEAVAYNRRNWRYIQRILENWTSEGKSNETDRRTDEGHLDPEKYLSGKYASRFRRG